MIRINKGAPPASLVRAKARYDVRDNDRYLKHQADYDSGAKKFTFTAAYRSKAVKNALTRSQHGKCCFCEAKFVNDDAHVEHFRPKGRVDAWPVGASSFPGYYWLAYEWDNLFLCKSTTNSSLKQNFFPLMGPVARNMNHFGIALESPVLIDPSKEDPRDFIGFVREEIVGLNDRGKQNIKLLGLRSPELDEARRTLYIKLKVMKETVDMLTAEGFSPHHPAIAQLIETLNEATDERSEFSSMAIDLLQGWPHLR